MENIPESIMKTLHRILEEAENCHCCGNKNDEEAFLCKICDKWACAKCESDNEFVCDTCKTIGSHASS